MKYSFFIFLLLCCTSYSFSQKIDDVITELEVLRIEKKLAGDEMKGRRTGTPGIEMAAAFIEQEFAQAGLSFLPGLKSYRQEFNLYRNKVLSITGGLDSQLVDLKNVIALSQDKEIKVDAAKFELVQIPKDSNLLDLAGKFIRAKKNLLVIVDTEHTKSFKRITRVERDPFAIAPVIIFILSKSVPATFDLEIKQEVTEYKFANIVGVLPGKSKPDESVIFSGHYDHLGIGKPNAAGDSIFNGANDDAAGVTAVIMLSKYLSKLKSNERSIIFTAFTAEEMGGYGSKYFSQQIDPANILAMFNIEMIGTESKWGINSAYITGYEKSDLGKILEKNLKGSKFTFHPDPYPAQDLFYRSDNATLAALGVPAHTISTSKMDSEPYYHSQDDEIETLDLQNMTEIIKAIAMSARGILSGMDTPSRVELKK